MEDRDEPLNAEIKIRVTEDMRDRIRVAVRDWPRATGERRITESEWLRVAIERLIAAGK